MALDRQHRAARGGEPTAAPARARGRWRRGRPAPEGPAPPRVAGAQEV